VLDAVSAQLDPRLGTVLRPFDRMRRGRNQAVYPVDDRSRFAPEETARDLPKVHAVLDAAAKVLDRMSPFQAEG